MNQICVGRYIKTLRLQRGMTQKDLAEKLNLSFQAVSKWEQGETLPDTALLLDLADLLEVSVDKLLHAGQVISREKKRIPVEAVVEGFDAIERVRACFGRESLFYLGMVDGINSQMNMDLEAHLADPEAREALYAEVILQYLDHGYGVDMDDVNAHLENPKLRELIRRRVKVIREGG